MQFHYGKVPRARQLAGSAVELSREALVRLRWIDFYLTRRRNAALTCRHFGISRQTFYRWWRRYDRQDLTQLESRSHRPHRGRQPTWTAELAERVRHLRGQYPRWGKDKLVVLLHREGRCVSTSMVGRILTRLKQRGVLVEPPARRVGKPRRLRHRLWAIRKPRHWRVCEPGDLVEVDTLDLRPVPGVLLKQFTARDVISRWDVVEARSRATASTAAEFLDTLQARMPFRSAPCRSTAAVSSPPSSSRLAGCATCDCSCCRRARRNSTGRSSARSAPTPRSSIRSPPAPGTCLRSTASYATGNGSTTPCARTKPWVI